MGGHWNSRGIRWPLQLEELYGGLQVIAIGLRCQCYGR